MTCTSCNRDFQAEKTGFVACPHCGFLNISAHTDASVHVHPSGTVVALSSPPRRRCGWWQLSRRATALLAVAVLLASVGGGMVAAHSRRADSVRTKPVAAATKQIHPSESTARPTQPAVTTAPRAEPAITKPVPTTAAPQPTLDSVVASINQQLRPYGVTATLTPLNNAGTNSTWNTLSPADLPELEQFATYLTQEFKKYPTDLVIHSRLTTIGMVKGLVVSGTARAAAPAPSISGMLYDVHTEVVSGSEYAREVVSHEYWHYLDYEMYGSYWYGDSSWTACNPSGFSYGAGGITAYDPKSGYVAAFHPRADFITTYSTYGIEEDRAEMFGWLMYDPARVKGLNDPGINCKIQRLTQLVHKFSPAMSF